MLLNFCFKTGTHHRCFMLKSFLRDAVLLLKKQSNFLGLL